MQLSALIKHLTHWRQNINFTSKRKKSSTKKTLRMDRSGWLYLLVKQNSTPNFNSTLPITGQFLPTLPKSINSSGLIYYKKIIAFHKDVYTEDNVPQ